ncbi:MAG: GumC family protein [Pseudomonadota bacterium]
MADASPASSVSLLSRVFGRRPNEAETVSQDAPAEEVAAEESPVSEDFAVEDEARAGAPEPFLASPLRRSAAPDDAFETGEAGETGLTLGGLLAALWRRKLGIVSFTGICAVIALGVLLSVRPQYEASTRLLVEPASSIVPDALLNGTTQSRERIILDAEAIASQVELLRSRAVADRVIEALDLANRLEFASPSALESLFAILGAAPDQASLREQAVETYSDNLSVFHIPETRVLGIAFRSYDAELAAQVANAVAESYLALQVLGKSDATQAANDWLGGEIDRLRERVAVAERRVQSFRADAGLIRGANDTTLPAQRLSEINSQIARARALRIDAEGDADQIRRALRTNAEDGLVGAVDAPVMQRLLERLADVRTQLADASTTLGPSHPRIKQLNAQLSDVGAQVRLEARRMAAALDEEARTAQAREETLRAELAALQGEAADAEFQDVELRALEREAKAQRDLLETLLGRYRETSARQNPAAQPADARVISPAIAPLEPAFPKTGPTLMAVIVAALMTACGVVVAGALLSAARPVRREADRDEADQETAFAPAPPAPDWSATVPAPPAPMMAAEFGGSEPPLSYEPADVEEAHETAEAPLEPVQPEHVDPAFAETPEPALRPEEPARPPLRPMRADSLAEIAYRVGGYADALPRVVVVAPGVPVAALTGLVLADHLARLGKTTVCVDAGTHAPGRRLVDLLGQAKGEGADDTGLSDLAMGAEFDEALRLIPGSRAHAITGGTHRPSLAVARETLDLLTETYDAIVVLAEARDLFDGQGLGLTSALVITDDCDAELIEATLSDLVSAGIEDVTMVTSDAAVVSLDEAA